MLATGVATLEATPQVTVILLIAEVPVAVKVTVLAEPVHVADRLSPATS